ncbi:hypothetical protein DL769_007163 [Monosporascus sp. CRB-8-3]|nr:hypothetical protein DL769_007163 [Monosporascus sp. CRB-8-3]
MEEFIFIHEDRKQQTWRHRRDQEGEERTTQDASHLVPSAGTEYPAFEGCYREQRTIPGLATPLVLDSEQGPRAKQRSQKKGGKARKGKSKSKSKKARGRKINRRLFISPSELCSAVEKWIDEELRPYRLEYPKHLGKRRSQDDRNGGFLRRN